MTERTVAEIKALFVSGAVPTSASFTDLIDTGYDSGDSALNDATTIGSYPSVIVVEQNGTNDATLLPVTKGIGLHLLGTETTASARQYVSAMSFGSTVFTTDTMNSARTLYNFSDYGITKAMGVDTAARGRDIIGVKGAAVYDAATSGEEIAIALQSDGKLGGVDARAVTHKYLTSKEIELDSTGVASVEVTVSADIHYMKIGGQFEFDNQNNILMMDTKMSGEAYTDNRVKMQVAGILFNGAAVNPYRYGQTPASLNGPWSFDKDTRVGFELSMFVNQALSGRPQGGGHFEGYAQLYGVQSYQQSTIILDGASLGLGTKKRMSHMMFHALHGPGNIKNGFFKIETIKRGTAA